MKRLKINQTADQKLWLFSDPHYGHTNICGGITKWVNLPIPYEQWQKENKEDLKNFCLNNGVRPFSSINKMNDAIVQGINENVGENDILICGGDWSFGGKENVKIFRDRIVCKNVHHVYGNHDEHIQDSRNDFKKLFSSTQSYLEVIVDGMMLCVFHYKPAIWNNSHKGSYFAYGHSHAAAEWITTGRSMDVGIDNAFRLLGEYRPFSFDEFMHLLKDRKAETIDHHGETLR